MSEKQACLKELTDEIKQLKTLIQEEDKRIEYLEKQIDHLEQCSRMEDLLISGFEIQQTFAQAVTGDAGEEIWSIPS